MPTKTIPNDIAAKYDIRRIATIFNGFTDKYSVINKAGTKIVNAGRDKVHKKSDNKIRVGLFFLIPIKSRVEVAKKTDSVYGRNIKQKLGMLKYIIISVNDAEINFTKK